MNYATIRQSVYWLSFASGKCMCKAAASSGTCAACSSSLNRNSLFDQQLRDAVEHAQLV